MSNICDDLRAAILQAAMQGKLTEQSEKEKVSELAEKVSCKELEEAPFIIPKNWRYIKLGDVATHQNGYAFKPSDWKLEGLPIIRIQDLTNKNNTPHYTDGKGIDGKYFINAGDVLVSWSCTIDSFLYDGEEAILNQHIFKVIFDKIEMDKGYYILAIKALLKTIDSKRHGSTMTHITKKDYDSLLMPVPPIPEQKRIVEKVDELMARVADLEQSADALASLKKAFTDDIKASLLQYAMQGKLTKQLPEDGDAEDLLEEIKAEKEKLIAEGKIKKQKPLKPITDDEIPFSIPENWKWVRVGEIFDHNTGKTKNASQNSVGTPRKYITTSNMYWNFFDFTKVGTMNFKDDELEKYTVKKGDLLVCEGGDFGRTAIWDQNEEVCFQNHIHRLRFFKDLSHRYFYWLFYFYKNTGLIRGKGIGIQGLSSGVLHNIAFPLPPLAEQKRIVERLESLMQNINTVGELIASEQSA